MRTNYVLIDFENVQPSELAGLEREHFKVLVFVGANQNKVNFETAAALQRLGPRAEYVKISKTGRNALDFHIAFHLGRLAAQDPTAYFHIVSEDTGFDPLIEHLRKCKIFAARSKDVADIPLRKATNAKSIPEKVAAVVTNLQQRGASRPRTLKTLSSTIGALFQKRLTAKELTAVLKSLQDMGVVTVQANKVTYALPATEA